MEGEKCDKDPIKTVAEDDDLVLKILSFITPTYCSEAYELATCLSEDSPRLHDLFVRNLRSVPLTLNCVLDADIDDIDIEKDPQFTEAQWAGNNNLKTGELVVSIQSDLCIDKFLEAFSHVDFSHLTKLELQVLAFPSRGFRFGRNRLESLYSRFAESNHLESLELRDSSNEDTLRALFALRSLRKLDLVCSKRVMFDALRDVEALPQLEHLKILNWCFTKGGNLTLNSPSLKVLDINISDVEINRLQCPHLKKIIFWDTCTLAGMPSSRLKADFALDTDQDRIVSLLPPQLQDLGFANSIIPVSGILDDQLPHESIHVHEECLIVLIG